MRLDNENIDLLVFFIVIVALTIIFVFSGLKIDQHRKHKLPDGMEAFI